MENNKHRKRPGWFSPIRINTKFRRKLVALFFAAILALVALTVRITVISATKGEEYKRIVLSNIQQQYESRVIPFKRGDITDRNGTLLAVSERVYNLVLDCPIVNHETEDDKGNKEQPYREPTLKALELLFGISRSDVIKILDADETKNSQYQILKENITMEQKTAWEEYCDLENEELTKEELEERSCINGIWFEESYKRVYPQNSLACDTIGFTYTLNDASWGIEGYYNDILNGTNGRKFGYFNSDADVEQTIIEPTNGRNIISTLDLNIQEIVREAIIEYEEEYCDLPDDPIGANNVAVLVMDPNTGEIYAMDSANWYDLNDPRDLTKILPESQTRNLSEDEKIEKLNEIWRNFCVSDAYEPGSVAKPLTVASALDTASITDTDIFECDGYEIVHGVEIQCSIFPDFHGKSDVYWAIANSCNDCLMQIGRKTGAENLLKYFSYFNFGNTTGIDLPGENPGILYTLEGMGELELCTASFGQGYTCTMVQEAAAISSIINGGYYIKPHVVSAVSDESGNILERYDPVIEGQTVSRRTSDMIKTAMGYSVSGGTSMESKVAGYSMGGKTGTAEKLPRGTGAYLTSFIGFAPLDNPEVLVYVIVDEPNIEEQDTSELAQTVAKNILSEVLPYLGVFPDEPISLDAAQKDSDSKENKDSEEDNGQANAADNESEEDPDNSNDEQAEESGEMKTEETVGNSAEEPDAGTGESPAEGQPEGSGGSQDEALPENVGEMPVETQPEDYAEPPGETQPEDYAEPPGEMQPEDYAEPSGETQPEDYAEPPGEAQPEDYAEPQEEAVPEDYYTGEDPGTDTTEGI